MHKKNILLLIIFFMSVAYISAQTLTLRVENIEPGKGHLWIAVFNDNRNNFPDNPFEWRKIPATNNVMEIAFFELPVGRYGIAVYQDANDNGIMDTNIFGIPIERYGFSNDVRIPGFRRTLFDFNRNMTITIRIR